MSVEFVPAAHVRELMTSIESARQRALDNMGVPPQPAGAAYWESLFEANAVEVLAALRTVKLDDSGSRKSLAGITFDSSGTTPSRRGLAGCSRMGGATWRIRVG